MSVTARLDSKLICCLQVNVNKVVLQENLELLIEVRSVLVFLSLAEWEVEINSFNFPDRLDGNGHQGLVAAGNGIASAFEVFESLFGYLYPSVEECRVKASLVLAKFALE